MQKKKRWRYNVFSVNVCLVLKVRPKVCALCWNETLFFWPDCSGLRSVWTWSMGVCFGGLQIEISFGLNHAKCRSSLLLRLSVTLLASRPVPAHLLCWVNVCWVSTLRFYSSLWWSVSTSLFFWEDPPSGNWSLQTVNSPSTGATVSSLVVLGAWSAFGLVWTRVRLLFSEPSFWSHWGQ